MSELTFTLPDLGEGLTEAQLVRWLVAEGELIAIDAPVAEVETAKAMVEVPSPYAGTVATLHGSEGATILVGQPLITVGTGATEPAAATYVEEERAGSGNVLIGYGTSEPGRTRRRRARGRTPARDRAVSGTAERPRAKSPLVRKLAKERGVDLALLTGTGQDGLITRADVERAAAPVAPGSDTADTDARTGLPIARRVALTGIRAAIASTLSRSRREIPEATTWVDVDATALLAARESLGTGLLSLLARFTVAGLRRYPVLNSRVDTDHGEIQVLDGVNLGVATQAERGLVVPVVRDAHRLTARELDTELRRTVAAARDGSAGAAELTGGSFTLNNYGSFGVDGSAAIINHPEVAILGVGRILPRPWIVGDEVVARQITQLSLVFDHRVCDGGTAAGFLRFVADAIEAPSSALADL
ncbi:dihydrolipoamide acetyltransferase family protein [Prauserella cavernicola]|uniref:Dihydrolipoamide acetyltransferase component of pyruvate dehydrogenase complex n=1 Tax=Prauserella cavernicola TaxID=2800127 RepID=A0A934V983_9PSEU|nr:dihydrolipoamide acetyltransferase family protein [Prauserella cavernicola]MBK1789070.1 2-oxo acid dehydrogenase subunit E2 [Prauserella cavernicola]